MTGGPARGPAVGDAAEAAPGAPDATGPGRLLRQVIGFGGVSAVGLALDYALFAALTAGGLPVFVANLISATCAVSLVYAVSVRHVFRTRPTHVRRPFVVYLAYQAVAVPAASLAVAGIETLMPDLPLVAKLLTLPVTFSANFLFMKWLLRDDPTTPNAPR